MCKEGQELVLWHTGRNWGGRQGWDVCPKRPGSSLPGEVRGSWGNSEVLEGKSRALCA